MFLWACLIVKYTTLCKHIHYVFSMIYCCSSCFEAVVLSVESADLTVSNNDCSHTLRGSRSYCSAQMQGNETALPKWNVATPK